MKFKVTNRLEASLHYGKTEFGPKETKILDFAPQSDAFIIEKLEEEEKPKKQKGGK